LAVEIAVLVNDSIGEGDTLIVESAGTPSHGTATKNAKGTVHYVPAKDYTGSDGFTYVVSDSAAGLSMRHGP
jgi:hypothetical protein